MPGRMLGRNGKTGLVSEIDVGGSRVRPKMGFLEPTNSRLYGLASFGKRVLLLYRSFWRREVEIKDSLSGRRTIYIGEGESLDYVKRTLLADARETSTTVLPICFLRQKITHLISFYAQVF